MLPHTLVCELLEELNPHMHVLPCSYGSADVYRAVLK